MKRTIETRTSSKINVLQQTKVFDDYNTKKIDQTLSKKMKFETEVPKSDDNSTSNQYCEFCLKKFKSLENHLKSRACVQNKVR